MLSPLLLWVLGSVPSNVAAAASIESVSIKPDITVRTFRPELFLGGALDGGERGFVEQTYRTHNLEAMRSVGYRSISYRLRTELEGEAWHWNPKGAWSDPVRAQGYWTSDSKPVAPIDLSWGYRLPHRGNTFDQGEDNGYSRIDDGDPKTYWKSNPYLDPAYSPSVPVRPQWIVVDLGHHVAVDAIRIRWANPYAVRFRVEYWQGDDNFEEDDDPDGIWTSFERGEVTSGRGGDQVLKLGPRRRARFVRIRLLASSHTAEPSPVKDPRDRMGFAVREIELGTLRDGLLTDAIDHGADNGQTPIYTSSTDPWHRESDRDVETEQPGFDRLFNSGLGGGRPVLVPVGVLFDTPENAGAELSWLQSRGYPIRGLEIGEEPDGQCVDPESYADLYLLFARRLKAIDPAARLGGPSLQSVPDTFSMWPDNRSESWTKRFLTAIRRAGRVGELNFYSFEWYPFDHPESDPRNELRLNPGLLEEAVKRLRADGLPNDLPLLMTEYGYSAFASPEAVDLPGAILNLDTVGAFLKLGGAAAYMYGYEPNELSVDHDDQWGAMATWLVDGKGNATAPTPIYWTARMLNQAWLGGSQPARLVRATCADPSLSVYPVVLPSGRLSVLLINKDGLRPRRMRLKVSGHPVWSGTVEQFGRDNYAWRAAGRNGWPIRSDPPSMKPFRDWVELPPKSISLVRL